MSFEEFLNSLLRHFSHNVSFPTIFLLLASMSLFCLFCFIQNKNPEISLSPPSDIFKTKACSKLALQSTDYRAALTETR